MGDVILELGAKVCKAFDAIGSQRLLAECGLVGSDDQYMIGLYALLLGATVFGTVVIGLLAFGGTRQ